MPILSILTPTIPSRRDKFFFPLAANLNFQKFKLKLDHPMLGEVEILHDDSKPFFDGGLSIGAKRNRLKEQATGDFLCFLDDDDGIAPNYMEALVRMCNECADVITFQSIVKNDYYWAIINMSLENRHNQEVNPDMVIQRTPWHINPIRSEIAKKYDFEDISHGEDWKWMEKVIPDLKTELHSNMILTQYNHSEKYSEADKIYRQKYL